MDTGQRRLMAMMPLHAITSTYGEQGLRERFAIEIASWPEPDRRRLNQALDLAARLHAADRRGREPFPQSLLAVGRGNRVQRHRRHEPSLAGVHVLELAHSDR